MAQPKWKLILANSADLSTVADLTSQAKSKQLQLALNKSGSVSFSIPITSNIADEILPVNKCVIVYKNDILVWSGPIWTVEEGLPENSISVNAVGWFEFLMKRYTLEQEVFPAGSNWGDIAFGFLQIANDQQDTYITEGSNDSTNEFTTERKYERFVSIGQEISNLSELESGFDFEVDPETRELNIYAQQMVDQENLLFGYNFGPNNVKSVKRTNSAEEMANDIYAIGAFLTAHSEDEDYQELYRMFTRVDSLSDVADQVVLAAYVNAEVEVNKGPRILIRFTPFPAGESNVPSLFEDYNLGDKVYLTAKYGNIQIENQAIRVFGLSVSIDENGNESVSEIQTTAA